MRRLVPWIVALAFAALAALLFVREMTSVRETRRADAAPVVAAIKKIAHLATVEVQIADVVRFEELKTVLIFDFPKSATLRMRGKAIAGFDLQSPDFKVRTDTGKGIVEVDLPPPRILAIDPRLEWFDEKSGLFNPITSAGPHALDALGAGPARPRGERCGHRGQGHRARSRAPRGDRRRPRLDGRGPERRENRRGRDARADAVASAGRGHDAAQRKTPRLPGAFGTCNGTALRALRLSAGSR